MLKDLSSPELADRNNCATSVENGNGVKLSQSRQRILANSLTRVAGERTKPDAGNGLNGIRLNLHHTPPWAY